ncbi:hypothetical protein V6C21_10040 [[Clostridium] cellulosi]|jgi:hypothetical protein
MRVYPFPDQIKSREELKRDLLYHKIPEEMRVPIADRAWQTGVDAAQKLIEKYPNKSIYDVAKAEGLTVDHRKVDKISGNLRYFSEYYSGRKTIFIYDDSVRLWAKANGLSTAAAEELILAHEIFHHLECTQIGKTSEQYTVPQIQIGRFSFGRTGIRALSEIGAHGFAYTWYQAHDKLPPKNQSSSVCLTNYAVNDVLFRGRNTAKKIFEDNPIMRVLTGKGRSKNGK